MLVYGFVFFPVCGGDRHRRSPLFGISVQLICGATCSLAVADPGFLKGGRQPRGGGADSWCSNISKILYVNTKESGPLEGGRRRRPLGFANALIWFSGTRTASRDGWDIPGLFSYSWTIRSILRCWHQLCQCIVNYILLQFHLVEKLGSVECYVRLQTKCSWVELE